MDGLRSSPVLGELIQMAHAWGVHTALWSLHSRSRYPHTPPAPGRLNWIKPVGLTQDGPDFVMGQVHCLGSASSSHPATIQSHIHEGQEPRVWACLPSSAALSTREPHGRAPSCGWTRESGSRLDCCKSPPLLQPQGALLNRSSQDSLRPLMIPGAIGT